MDREKLEKETYAALKQYLESNHDEGAGEEDLLCEIPPGILSYVLESLVTPVITTILADYIIRKWQSIRDKKNIAEIEELKGQAIKKVGKLIKELGIKKERAEEVCGKVSVTITAELEAASEEELEEAILFIKENLG